MGTAPEVTALNKAGGSPGVPALGSGMLNRTDGPTPSILSDVASVSQVQNAIGEEDDSEK